MIISEDAGEVRRRHLDGTVGRFPLRVPFALAHEPGLDPHLRTGHVWRYAKGVPGDGDALGAWLIPADSPLLPPSARGWMVLVDSRWLTCADPGCPLCSEAWLQLEELAQAGPVFTPQDVSLPPAEGPAPQVWVNGILQEAESVAEFERRGVYLAQPMKETDS